MSEQIKCSIEGINYSCESFRFSVDKTGPRVTVALSQYDRVGYRGKRHVEIRYLDRLVVIGDYFLTDSYRDGNITYLWLKDR